MINYGKNYWRAIEPRRGDARQFIGKNQPPVMMLPALKPPACEPIPPPHPPPRQPLLIVDDEAGPRDSLQVLFQDQYDILVAANGNMAAELAAQNPVDAVVLDIRMAGLSGIEVLEHLKKNDPALEVVMLTAYETLATAQQALRLGACDYLAKPFEVGTMRKAVATAMARRAVSKEIRDNDQKLRRLKEEIKHYQLHYEILNTRGQIYASILHDMNNPLMIIGGYLGLIDAELGKSTRLEGESLETIREHLAFITNQLRLCSEIAQRYRRFIREQPAENASVAVNSTLQLVAQLLAMHPSGKGHRVLTQLLAKDVSVKVNGTELIQILLNLGINGLQCTDQPHHVEIDARVLSQALHLSELVDGPESLFLNREGFLNEAPLLALSIADNGPGIAPEILPRIFEPLFTTKPVDKGTGLGLAIVLRLVQEARGAIHLRTRVSQGTTFTLFLPIAKEAATP